MVAYFQDDSFPAGLPIGRLVQGDCYEQQPQRDAAGKPKINATTGQVDMRYYMLVAYAKTDPAFVPFRAFLALEAKQAWPQFHDAAGANTNPSFADKVIDGDGRDEKGKPWADREGFAGHWVLRYGSTFAPKVFEWDPALGAFKETAPGRIKLGDYIKLSGSTQSNNSAQSPGMYVNPTLIAFDREGDRIVVGPSADQAFRAPTGAGGAAAPLAAGGLTMTALAGAFTYAQMIAQGWTDATLIEKGYATAAPAAPVAPPAPPAPASPPPPPAPPAPPYDGHMQTPAPVMTAKAGATSYQSFRDAGWTDEQLVAQGMMAPAA